MESESNCIYKCLQKQRAAGRTPTVPLQGFSLHIHMDAAAAHWLSHTIEQMILFDLLTKREV